ncbi:MAG: prepilin peptidase [Lachnospiraceae bacterium]|nr:prepilin peptidase [Lachnospiraceae bacterium]
MLIFLNILCIIIIFFIGADIFSLADELSFCRTNNIDILKRKYSTCRECGHRLRVKDTFPVISRFINKGKCRFCDAPFPKRSFYTEIAGGLLALLVYVFLYYVDNISIFLAALVTIITSIICMLVISSIYTGLKINKSGNIMDKKENNDKVKKDRKTQQKEKIDEED